MIEMTNKMANVAGTLGEMQDRMDELEKAHPYYKEKKHSEDPARGKYE